MRPLLIGLIGLVAAACQTTETRIGAGPVPKNATMERCISNYMQQNGFALALAVDGSSCGWVYCPDNACRTGASMQRAIMICEKNSSADCAVYAYRKEVVWKTDETGPVTKDAPWYASARSFKDLPIRVYDDNKTIQNRKPALLSYRRLLDENQNYYGVFAVGGADTWGYGVAKENGNKPQTKLQAAKNALASCEEKSKTNCRLWIDHRTVISNGVSLDELVSSLE
ncbi:hypothetical protein HH303_15530 [Rhodospirillaceae bacterium KN72]|uniref:DUF4189 domain-containing protein n=1 Tax=Pacificispira spongiicola TaxID=2729598 RepID=A0A7Y0HGQ5_9PROT|nr:hypothetical protein [Pacificispira spongiicola]NMM45908.1 hypothetical protein [Pacificispira spongiicola]